MVFIRVTDPGRFLTDTDPDDEKNLIWAPMRFYTHKLKMQPSVFSPYIKCEALLVLGISARRHVPTRLLASSLLQILRI